MARDLVPRQDVARKLESFTPRYGKKQTIRPRAAHGGRTANGGISDGSRRRGVYDVFARRPIALFGNHPSIYIYRAPIKGVGEYYGFGARV